VTCKGIGNGHAYLTDAIPRGEALLATAAAPCDAEGP
jgi:hypothetical protein